MHETAGLLPIMIPVILGAGVLLAASVHDVALRTVPNALCLLLAADGIVLRVLSHSLLSGAATAALVFAAGAVCWRRGWLGGGDVKLLAAASLLLPPYHVPDFVLGVGLAGGGLAIVYLVLRAVVRAPRPGRPSGLLGRLIRVERWRIARRGSLPYASAIAAGALYTLFIG